MMKYEVVIHNLRKDRFECQSNAFHVDRRSPVGNPNVMHKESERAAVCKAYEIYFRQMIKCVGPFQEYIEEIYYALCKYGVVHLFCWCVPKQCHAQTIKSYLLERIEKEKR